VLQAEEMADDDDSWGKTTARSRGLATSKESQNGGVKQQLAGGERQVVAYLMDGKRMVMGKNLRLGTKPGPCVGNGKPTASRLAEPWHDANSLTPVSHARVRSVFKDQPGHCFKWVGPVQRDGQ
jgi:hypothetical protein